MSVAVSATNALSQIEQLNQQNSQMREVASKCDKSLPRGTELDPKIVSTISQVFSEGTNRLVNFYTTQKSDRSQTSAQVRDQMYNDIHAKENEIANVLSQNSISPKDILEYACKTKNKELFDVCKRMFLHYGNFSFTQNYLMSCCRNVGYEVEQIKYPVEKDTSCVIL